MNTTQTKPAASPHAPGAAVIPAIDDADRAAIRAEVRRARRAYAIWRRVMREESGSLNPMQLAVCEGRLSTLARECIAAEHEAEDYGVKVPVRR